MTECLLLSTYTHTPPHR